MPESMSSHPGEQLYARWLSGDPDALGQLAKVLYPALTRYLAALGSPEHAREDLAQDAIIALHAARNPPRGFVRAYVFKTARNMHHRWLRRHRETTHDEALVASLAAQSARYSRALDAAREKNLHVQCLRRVKSDYLEVLLLHKYGGLRYREIATIFDCTEARARRMAFEAVKQFQAELAGLRNAAARELHTQTSFSEYVEDVVARRKRIDDSSS